MKTVHAFVICWPGKEESAEIIASSLMGGDDRVTVIYSTADGSRRSGSGEWVQVPNDWFYGRKFRRSAELSAADITLQIQADVSCNDWRRLIDRCRHVHETLPDVGVWGPEVTYTPWDTWSIEIVRDLDKQLSFVVQTDGVCWSFSKPVLERLKELQYEMNNLGWGVEWAAALYAHTNSLMVVRDLSVEVFHPPGTGYSRGEADKQMAAFIGQLSPQEQVAYKLHNDFVAHKRNAQAQRT